MNFPAVCVFRVMCAVCVMCVFSNDRLDCVYLRTNVYIQEDPDLQSISRIAEQEGIQLSQVINCVIIFL